MALDASCAAAMAVLKEHELGPRKQVVLAALKWRREVAEEAGTTSGTTLVGTSPEPPREPQGANP